MQRLCGERKQIDVRQRKYIEFFYVSVITQTRLRLQSIVRLSMKRIIFFDGHCNLCNSLVSFLFKIDKNHLFKFSSLQSKTAATELSQQDQRLDSIVVLIGGEKLYRSNAIIRIFYELGGSYTILAMLMSIMPLFLRDIFYKFIAQNRFKIFGRKDTCRLPTEEERSYFLD
jgi:predicted DCC family thiol-disulfide oxidoreductase YuxK